MTDEQTRQAYAANATHYSKEWLDQPAPSDLYLQRVIKPAGVLYLSWRVTQGADQRHPDGRLYAAFDPAMVQAQLQACSIPHVDDTRSLGSGKRICRIIAKDCCSSSAAITTKRRCNARWRAGRRRRWKQRRPKPGLWSLPAAHSPNGMRIRKAAPSRTCRC